MKEYFIPGSNPGRSETTPMLLFKHWTKQIIRSFFDRQGFLEIDSPILIENFTEEFITPITTSTNMELRTSPELHLKNAITLGYNKIYELGHVFRQETKEDNLHSNEFSMLEWYRSNSTLDQLIKDCEMLFSKLAPSLFYNKFEKETLNNLWKKFTPINLEAALERNDLPKQAFQNGFTHTPSEKFHDVFSLIMSTIIEPQIGIITPCVVTDWPYQLSAFSKTTSLNPLWCSRFEIYYNGIELANAFSELYDPIEQEKRLFFSQKRQQYHKIPNPILLKYLPSIKSTAGISIGIDRLLMIIAGKPNIQNCK